MYALHAHTAFTYTHTYYFVLHGMLPGSAKTTLCPFVFVLSRILCGVMWCSMMISSNSLIRNGLGRTAFDPHVRKYETSSGMRLPVTPMMKTSDPMSRISLAATGPIMTGIS